MIREDTLKCDSVQTNKIKMTMTMREICLWLVPGVPLVVCVFAPSPPSESLE